MAYSVVQLHPVEDDNEGCVHAESIGGSSCVIVVVHPDTGITVVNGFGRVGERTVVRFEIVLYFLYSRMRVSSAGLRQAVSLFLVRLLSKLSISSFSSSMFSPRSVSIGGGVAESMLICRCLAGSDAVE